jgi:hypothetical protein
MNYIKINCITYCHTFSKMNQPKRYVQKISSYVTAVEISAIMYVRGCVLNFEN